MTERNFCPRCGKRMGTNEWDIHTCTPPDQFRDATKMMSEDIVEKAIQGHASTRDAIRWAMKQEREACAKEADMRLYDFTMLTSNPPQSGAAFSIANAIRARGEA